MGRERVPVRLRQNFLVCSRYQRCFLPLNHPPPTPDTDLKAVEDVWSNLTSKGDTSGRWSGSKRLTANAVASWPRACRDTRRRDGVRSSRRCRAAARRRTARSARGSAIEHNPVCEQQGLQGQRQRRPSSLSAHAGEPRGPGAARARPRRGPTVPEERLLPAGGSAQPPAAAPGPAPAPRHHQAAPLRRAPHPPRAQRGSDGPPRPARTSAEIEGHVLLAAVVPTWGDGGREAR